MCICQSMSKSMTGRRTGQSLFFCQNSIISCFITSFTVLEHTLPFLDCTYFSFLEHPILFKNVHFLFFGFFWESDFVPGCPRTESDFVPGRPRTEEFLPRFLLLPLPRDKGTAGQGYIFFPGQRDNGMTRSLETLLSTLTKGLKMKLW